MNTERLLTICDQVLAYISEATLNVQIQQTRDLLQADVNGSNEATQTAFFAQIDSLLEAVTLDSTDLTPIEREYISHITVKDLRGTEILPKNLCPKFGLHQIEDPCVSSDEQ